MEKRKKKYKTHFLSVIVPTYKQEKTIKKNIISLCEVLSQLRYPFELIVVVDGKFDKTFQEASKIKGKEVKIVGYEHNCGKGYAIRFGMSFAKGDYIAFLDAGMDLNPNGIALFLEQMEWFDADIVIGSKLHPFSKVIYPWQRRLLSWGYRSIVRTLFGLRVYDTQVGIKVFKRNVLEDVLPRLIVKRFAFDIEILAVANYLGYKRILESPIELTFGEWSSITTRNFWEAIINMMLDTLGVFYRLRILHYYDNKSKRKWRYDPELNFRVNLP